MAAPEIYRAVLFDFVGVELGAVEHLRWGYQREHGAFRWTCSGCCDPFGDDCEAEGHAPSFIDAATELEAHLVEANDGVRL